MSKRRKSASAITGALVVALALSACGGGGGKPISAAEADTHTTGAMSNYQVGDQFTATKPLTFSILYMDNPNYPIKSDWLFWKDLTKLTNVTLKPTVVPMSDYSQKRSLLVGSGDAPFIIPKTYPGQETSFVSSGAILPVSDYLDLMPNFEAKVKEWGLEKNLDTLRQADGKFYVLPGLHQAPWQDYSIAMRTDVLKKLGIPMPTTWDQFRDALRAIKKAYPDSYPLSDRFSVGQSVPLANLLSLVAVGYGTSAGWNFDPAQWNPKTKSFEFTGACEQYKQMVEYLHSLYAEGLLDPESITQDDDTAISKFVTGKSFAISSNAQNIVNDYETPLAKNIPGATVAKIPFPAGPAGNLISSGTLLENGIMISAAAAKSPDFVAMMQFIDWLYYSDAGEEFAKWGVQGVTYTKDANGKRTLAPDVDFVGLNPSGTKHLQKDFGFSNGVFAYGGSTDLLDSTFSPDELAFQASNSGKTLTPLAPPHPFNDVEQERSTLLITPLTDAMNQATIQFIVGQRKMSDWDSYIKELKGLGMDTYVNMLNTAYHRYAKEHG